MLLIFLMSTLYKFSIKKSLFFDDQNKKKILLCNFWMFFFLSLMQTDFHDTGRGPRVSSMIDIYGFTMASINESGCVFANPSKGEKNMSVLMYRPFKSWASNSEVRILTFPTFRPAQKIIDLLVYFCLEHEVDNEV